MLFRNNHPTNSYKNATTFKLNNKPLFSKSGVSLRYFTAITSTPLMKWLGHCFITNNIDPPTALSDDFNACFIGLGI